jgi:hypothetical protein
MSAVLRGRRGGKGRLSKELAAIGGVFICVS